MRKFSPILVLISALLISAGMPPLDDQPQVYAVIVGVSKYKDTSINPLLYAHRDAETYRNFLESSKGGSVPSENIVLLTNERATRSTIIRNVRDMFDKATEEDMVIFYFSGHGVPDGKISSDLYLITHDTDDENYTGTALLKDDVSRQFTNSRAKLKLFLADACHSGGTGIHLGIKDDGAEAVNTLMKNISDLKDPSWAVITASSNNEKSFEDTKWGGGHGVFTYQLIQGLEGNADKTSKQNPKAKGNGDGIVTVREIFDYLSNVIPAETQNKQHPDKIGRNEDIFPLSALTSDKFAGAIKKYKKEKIAVASGGDNADAEPTLTNKDEVKKFDTQTKELTANFCVTGSWAFGGYCFVNNLGEDIVLTSNTGGVDMQKGINVMIAAGEKACVERIRISSISNNMIATPTRDCTFYFKTIGDGVPIKYGTRTLTVEACKMKTDVLSRKTLYLAVDGKKF